MANKVAGGYDEFRIHVRALAMSTLAYHLATEEQRTVLINLFELVADHVQNAAPEADRQAKYAKTLLGVDNAIEIEAWVNQNRESLLNLTTSAEWLGAVWPLFCAQLDDPFFHKIEPSTLPVELAVCWINGASYGEIIASAAAQNATKPWGEKQRRRISEADVVDFLESTLGFDCSLILAAVAQFLFGEHPFGDENTKALTLFQKSLKYGLPDQLAISCFERGFSDRVVALELRNALYQAGFENTYIGPALSSYRELFESTLSRFPSYYSAVLQSI